VDLHISPTTLQQQVVERLRFAILGGEFKRGQRLVESSLCEKMGISRPSLREALRSLEAEKLIEIIPTRGPIIPYMTWEEAQQIYDVRALIEGEAAALAAQNITDDAIDQLRGALKSFSKADKTGNVSERVATTTGFYDIIFRSSGNAVLEDMARGLLARINFLRLQSMSRPGRGKHSFAEMTAIFEAIGRRNAKASRMAAVTHVKRACDAARLVFEAPPQSRSRS
jgi:DNA-binding GntR family transcriptional regulator